MSSEILDYIGLNINSIQNDLICEKPIFKTSKTVDNSEIYRVYKNIQIKDLDILISDSDRTTDIAQRYSKAKTLNEFIKDEKEMFEELLEKASILEIKKLEDLQDKLQERIPFFIKYDKNYLWQIYYSKEEDKYFMLFPAKEGETSVLFYIIKKKLENPYYKIFVPICKSDYDERLLSKKEISDLENYIWAFTENWPMIYEVSDSKIYIIGKAKLDEQLESKFRIEIKSREDGLNLYTLAKALFILITETDYKGKIKINITENGGLKFYYINDDKFNNIENVNNIDITNLSEFISEQVILKQKEKKKILNEINANQKKLTEIRLQIQKENDLYVRQEKQIVLFLECKKSFFKKITYFFKSSKNIKMATLTGKHLKDSDKDKLNNEKNQILDENDNLSEKENKSDYNNDLNLTISQISNVYTLADLVKVCMQNLSAKNNLKDTKNDLKALILKQENLEKKIENAKLYLKEIEKHKKSIFEFWKFSNKDEKKELEEGNISDKNIEEKHLQLTYNLNEDIEEFAQKVDELQKRKLSTDECNAVFICNYVLNSINAIIKEQKIKNEFDKCNNEGLKNQNDEKIKELDKTISSELERLKENYKQNQSEEIFGELVDDYTKIKSLKDKEHRENQKDIYSILKIRKDTTLEEYKNMLNEYIKLLNEAFNKITSIADIPIYYVDENKEDRKDENTIEYEKYIIGDIHPSNLINNNTMIYKINTKSDMHLIYFSNIIFYDNYNKTLPSGMDESTKVLIKLQKENYEKTEYNEANKEENNSQLKSEKNFNILIEKNQFDIEIKKIKIINVK